MPNTIEWSFVFGILRLAENQIQTERVLLKNASLADPVLLTIRKLC